jgi:hypothetical protein
MGATHRTIGLAAAVVLALAAAAMTGCVDSATLEKVFQDDGALDEATVADGLREALRIGTERATASTSRLDGFYKNALIRIALPEQYDGVAKTLRSFGMGSYVEDFERSMNRAAERASGEAIDVFWSAIKKMGIPDAFEILYGGETAATEYFRRTTTDELTTRFHPIVTASMEAVGVYNVYNDLVARYNQLPIQKPEAVDIDEYVTARTIDGIFVVLEGEEKRIREDPAARTTELLKKVFGQSDNSR